MKRKKVEAFVLPALPEGWCRNEKRHPYPRAWHHVAKWMGDDVARWMGDEAYLNHCRAEPETYRLCGEVRELWFVSTRPARALLGQITLIEPKFTTAQAAITYWELTRERS